jgi:hypothetical protein
MNDDPSLQQPHKWVVAMKTAFDTQRETEENIVD